MDHTDLLGMNLDEPPVSPTAEGQQVPVKDDGARVEEPNDRPKGSIPSAKEKVFMYLAQHWEDIKPFASLNAVDQQRMEEIVEYRKTNKIQDPSPIVRPQPPEILATLRDYQLFGFNWLANLYDIGSGGGILADEMGLGKTLQTITLLTHLKFTKGINGPFLVLAPLSVLPAWIKELGNWSPKMKVLKFHGQSAQRDLLREEINDPDLDVIVTSYEMAISETDTLSHIDWCCLVLDEGHKIKNNKTNTYKFISSLQASFKLVLTGTPIQNNTRELWALLSFLYPQVFRLPDEFTAIDDQTKSSKLDNTLLTSLHKLIQLVMLRRLKTDVAIDLPPKVETKVYLPLTGTQVTWYKKLLTENPEKLKDKANLMKLIMNLRKCVNHPYLINPINPGETVKEEGGEHLVSCSAKLCFIDKLLPKLKSQQSQVLIYSQFLGVLDILEEYCQFRGHKYVRLDGGVHPTKRNVIINAFTHKDSDIFVFLLSTRSGGLGINLMTANTVIIHDSDWNPQMDVQAMARAHRIGQKSSVNIYRLLTKDTIEERILDAANQKLYLEAVVVRKDEGTSSKSKKKKEVEKPVEKAPEDGGDEETKTLSKLLPKDLLKLATFGANQIFKADSEADITGVDLDTFLQASQDHQAGLSNPKQESFENGEFNASSFQGWVKLASSFKFQGKDYEKIVRSKAKSGSAQAVEAESTWVDLGKRKRSSKFVLVDGELVHASNGQEEAEDPSLKHSPKKKKLKNWTQDSVCDFCKQSISIVDKIACQRCPKCFHLDCIALRSRPKRWACPWHCCCKCGNSSSISGGILCQCETCINSYCETCFFEESKEHFMEYVNNSLFEEKFDYHKQQTIYIRCRFCVAKKKALANSQAVETTDKIKTEPNGGSTAVKTTDDAASETTTDKIKTESNTDAMAVEPKTTDGKPNETAAESKTTDSTPEPKPFQLNPYYPDVGKRVIIREGEQISRGTVFRYSPESNEYFLLFDGGVEQWLPQNTETWQFVDRKTERVLLKKLDEEEAAAEAAAQAEAEAEAAAKAEARAAAKAERDAAAKIKSEERAAARAEAAEQARQAQQAKQAAQAQAHAQQQALRQQQASQQAAAHRQWSSYPSYYSNMGLTTGLPMSPHMSRNMMLAQGHMGHPGMGHPSMGHPGMGHHSMGHPGMGHHPSMGHPGMSHPGMGHHPSMGHPGMMHSSMNHPNMGHPTAHSNVGNPSMGHSSMSHPSMMHPSMNHPSMGHPTSHLGHSNTGNPNMHTSAGHPTGNLNGNSGVNPSMSNPNMGHPSAHPSIGHPSIYNPGMSNPSMNNLSMNNPSMNNPNTNNPNSGYPSVGNSSMSNLNSNAGHPSINNSSMSNPNPNIGHPSNPIISNAGNLSASNPLINSSLNTLPISSSNLPLSSSNLPLSSSNLPLSSSNPTLNNVNNLTTVNPPTGNEQLSTFFFDNKRG